MRTTGVSEAAVSEQQSSHLLDGKPPPFDELPMEHHTDNNSDENVEEGSEEQQPCQQQLHHPSASDSPIHSLQPIAQLTVEAAYDAMGESASGSEVEGVQQADDFTLHPTGIKSIAHPPSHRVTLS